MAENSAIEWTTHTFNPWWGCQAVSPGCDHCYAEALDKRFGGAHFGPGAERRRTKSWSGPRKWNRIAAETGTRPRVFCASMSDVFDNAVPVEWRNDLWRLIDETPNLDWLLLTKRPQNIAKMLPGEHIGLIPWGVGGWPNVWLGTTVENQAEAERRIDVLAAVPTLTRFLSMEPLLGPVVPDLTHIHWVIVGGESGPGARPMHPDWARMLRDQCAAAGVPFLFKQWGDWISHLDRDKDDPDWRADYRRFEQIGCRVHNLAGGFGFHGERVHIMKNIGKKAAGRVLDGVTHDGYPHGMEAAHG